MAVQTDNGAIDDIKTQFSTVEGVYKLLPVPEYNRQNRLVYNNSGSCSSGPPVKISFLCLSDSKVRGSSPCDTLNSKSFASQSERTNICYNFSRDLYVYSYRNLKKNGEIDLPKPIEKRSYNKGDVPTCHDFNSTSATLDRVSLLVGLLGGQIQLFDPLSKEINKTFNAGERLIEKTKVTCIKWIPGSFNQFLVSHGSGNMYIYNEELLCSLDKPIYQLFKHGEGFTIYTCKARSTRNPLYKWSIGEGSVNEFMFSPCSKYLAVVSQDGFLRVFNFDTMDLIGNARSYYGGLLCVCWSPDGKYVVTGGEDDLITIWSFYEKRIVARCQGHKSWVTVVAFDPYTTVITDKECSDVRSTSSSVLSDFKNGKVSSSSSCSSHSNRNSISSDGLIMPVTSYRLGSVSQDTFLCLWDLKDDMLQQPYFRPRTNTALSARSSLSTSINSQNHPNSQPNCTKSNHTRDSSGNNDYSYSNSFTARLASLNFSDKKERDHKRSLSSSSKNSIGNNKNNLDKSSLGSGHSSTNSQNFAKFESSHTVCPRLDECPMLEPMVCKKIGHERLCGLIFREDSIITSCQDGCILTWCRPGKHCGYIHHPETSPTGLCLGENVTDSSYGTGTIV